MAKTKNRLVNNEKGLASIEYAIVIPVLLALIGAVIDFGIYLIKDEMTANRIGNITLAIEQDPTFTPAKFKALVNSYNTSFLTFNKVSDPNTYICAVASTSSTPATSCVVARGYNGPPAGAVSYYVTVLGQVSNADSTISPLRKLVPAMNSIKIVQSSGAVEIGQAGLTPPQCTGAGNFLQYDPTKNPPWQCVPFAQVGATNCTEPWQNLGYNSGTWVCNNVPYTFAGGIVPVLTGGGGNASWQTNSSNVPWVTTTSWTSSLQWVSFCVNNPVTFSVPAGMPGGGSFIAQANVIAPGAGNGPNFGWHNFIAFIEEGGIPSPPSGGTGSANLCVATGGNWVSNNFPAPGPGVGGVSIAWSITYVPPVAR